MMMKLGFGLAGIAVAVLVAGALVAGRGASAQTPPEERENRAERYRELLAAELGITVEELTEAKTAARDQLIDEMAAAGEITEERAERLKALEPGEGLRFGIAAHRFGHKVRGAILEVFQAASEVVGVPADELRERLAGGESLVDIASGEGIDETTLKDDLTAALTERINRAVADGDLSQQVADRLLENLEAMVERAINAEGPFQRWMR